MLKEQDLFISEDLTKKPSGLAAQARQARFDGKLALTWVSHGRILCKCVDDKKAKTFVVKNEEELKKIIARDSQSQS